MKTIISLILLISLADSFVINKNKPKIPLTNLNRSKRDSIGQNRLLNSRDRHYQALYVDSKRKNSIDSKIASFYLQNAENLNRDFLQKLVKQLGKKQSTKGRGRRLRNFKNHFSRQYNPWSRFIYTFLIENLSDFANLSETQGLKYRLFLRKFIINWAQLDSFTLFYNHNIKSKTQRSLHWTNHEFNKIKSIVLICSNC